MEFDLTLNFFVLAVDAALRAQPAGRAGRDGARASARSSSCYDPFALLDGRARRPPPRRARRARPERGMTIPSRARPSADRVRRLGRRRRRSSATSTRSATDAPNAEGGTNIDYIVRYNGFADREELYEAVLATEHWTAFIGFFPGLPFMFPLDPRDASSSRSTTRRARGRPEGAVGIGGPVLRDLPGRVGGRLPADRPDAADLRRPRSATRCSARTRCCSAPATASQFHRVDEEELLQAFEDVHADTLPLPDRGQPVRRRRVPRVAAATRSTRRRRRSARDGARRRRRRRPVP